MVYRFNAEFHDDDNFRLTFKDDLEADLSSSLAVSVFIPTDPYSGPYAVTPSEHTQVLHTANLSMANDVTVNPIPSNYGRITWDGHTLTVS